MQCEHMTCHQCTDAEVTTLRTTLARLTADLAAVTAERDEALADVAAAEAPLTDIVLRHHAAMSQVERERDEARGLLGEAHHVLDQMHDEDDTIGRLKVDVPADGHPRQWLFDYVTQYGHGLRARIAAHLGRSE